MDPEAQIRARIRTEGRITFAEFMEAALYHPTGGFYSKGGGVGPDFFTNPTAHPAFGALIANQLRSMWEALGRTSPMYVVEPGAGSGLLAADVLAAASGSFAEALVYVTVDRAGRATIPSAAHRVKAARLPFRGLTGCVLSNELIDAFPVHRFRVVDGRFEELYVVLDADGALIDLPGPPSSDLEPHIRSLDADLPDGFRGEVCPAIYPWAAEVADALDRGFVMTIDYGYAGDEVLRPDRANGTLQTYHRHTQGAELYQAIGSRDITADVDFGRLEAAGLRTVGRVSQADFLKRNGFDGMLHRLRRMSLGERERQANRMGMLELVKPEGLGGLKVLVQEKNTGVADIGQLAPDSSSVNAANVPLLGPNHIHLAAGRYPHTEWDPGDLWPFNQ